jgi:hypothetical protein
MTSRDARRRRNFQFDSLEGRISLSHVGNPARSAHVRAHTDHSGGDNEAASADRNDSPGRDQGSGPSRDSSRGER